MVGILGILWWDLRGFRTEAFGLRQEIQDFRLEIQEDREKLRQQIDKKYVDKESHGQLCEIAQLKVTQAIKVAVNEAFEENGR